MITFIYILQYQTIECEIIECFTSIEKAKQAKEKYLKNPWFAGSARDEFNIIKRKLQ